MLKIYLFIVTAFFLFACTKKEEEKTELLQKTDSLKQRTDIKQVQKDTTSVINKETKVTESKSEEIKKTELTSKEKEKKSETEKDNKKTTEIKKENKSENQDEINFHPIWMKKCKKCHGADGKGKIEGVPDLTKSIFKKKSDNTLYKSISNGIEAENEDEEDMPAWKGKLTEEEIKAAVKFVKGL